MLINNGYTASGKTPKIAFLICLSILVVTYLITTYACIQDKELYIFILEEDGPLENIATASVFIASLLFLSAFIRYRNTPAKFYYLLFSCALLFLFFEELSWGQRIFNIATPEVFENLNAQKELNLHNYSPIYKHVNKVAYAGLQFYLAGLVLLTLVFERFYGLIVRLRIPMASPATAFLMCLNYFIYHDIFSI